MCAAAAAGNLASVQTLLTAGADVHGAGGVGHTPLWHALANGHAAVATLLRGMGATVPPSAAQRALSRAVVRGKAATVRACVELGADPNGGVPAADGHIVPLVWVAALHQDGRAVAELLACGAANVPLHAVTSKRPLLAAAVCQLSLPVINALLHGGVSPYNEPPPSAHADSAALTFDELVQPAAMACSMALAWLTSARLPAAGLPGMKRTDARRAPSPERETSAATAAPAAGGAGAPPTGSAHGAVTPWTVWQRLTNSAVAPQMWDWHRSCLVHYHGLYHVPDHRLAARWYDGQTVCAVHLTLERAAAWWRRRSAVVAVWMD
jgi:hypothetical protein